MADPGNSDDAAGRRARRLDGPIEAYRLGATDVPVRIYDLSLDGCLVEMSFGPLSGRDIHLQIDLPGEGWTVVRCETLHIAGHNTFVVKFVRLDEETRSRIGRTIDRLLDRPLQGKSPVNKGNADAD